MAQKYPFRSGKKIRFALVGTLAITSLVVSGKLFTQLIAHTSAAQQTIVKEESVTAEDVPEAKREGGTITPLKAIDDKPQITIYTVARGDTLSEIAEQFSVSTNTILWANDLNSKSQIKVGQKLTILPVSGIEYIVKKGDTLSGIVAKYGGDTEEIIAINNLESAKDIRAGMELMIPDGEFTGAPAKVVATKSAPVQKVAPKIESDVSLAKTTEATVETKNSDDDNKDTDTSTSEKSSSGVVYVHPIPHSQLTQGTHGYNGVDFGAPIGTPVFASAAGTVIVAKGNGAYNGGYGNYIVVSHPKGSQTLYAHLSKVSVSIGEEVAQGEEIAKSGNTGKSTGPHLHFEVRGASNPWAKDKKGTRY